MSVQKISGVLLRTNCKTVQTRKTALSSQRSILCVYGNEIPFTGYGKVIKSMFNKSGEKDLMDWSESELDVSNEVVLNETGKRKLRNYAKRLEILGEKMTIRLKKLERQMEGIDWEFQIANNRGWDNFQEYNNTPKDDPDAERVKHEYEWAEEECHNWRIKSENIHKEVKDLKEKIASNSEKLTIINSKLDSKK